MTNSSFIIADIVTTLVILNIYIYKKRGHNKRMYYTRLQAK